MSHSSAPRLSDEAPNPNFSMVPGASGEKEAAGTPSIALVWHYRLITADEALAAHLPVFALTLLCKLKTQTVVD
jgi:hypothetical protein